MAQALASAAPKVVVYDGGLMPRFPDYLRRVLPGARAAGLPDRDLDARGRLHVIDRLKDVMTRGGRNVYPRRVEEACCDHPMVKEAAAVQMPHSERLVLAVSVRKAQRGSPDTERLRGELLHHLVERLDSYERPDAVEILPELPRSLQGKVLKREVRDALAARRA
ncbi:MAG: hypothetical protein ABR576_14030 [Thermoanaerobaculia bacterium]